MHRRPGLLPRTHQRGHALAVDELQACQIDDDLALGAATAATAATTLAAPATSSWPRNATIT
jgi:hypothetical protein